MDTAKLHSVIEEFASYLSELSEGDLRRPTPCTGWDVDDLCSHMVEENIAFGAGVAGKTVRPLTRHEPEARQHRESAGSAWEQKYLETALYMENSFAAVQGPSELRKVAGLPGERAVDALYEMQICDSVIHTWDLTQALGFTYDPAPEVADLVLRRMQEIPDAARGEGRAFGTVTDSATADLSVLERIVLLSGRELCPPCHLIAHPPLTPPE